MNIDKKELRKYIGFVIQKPVVFDNTIIYNLLYGSDITREVLVSTIHQLGLDYFFNNFPNNIDTYIGKNGINISGGQLQVIQILRVILFNPKIIIMDEPTSYIDVYNKEVVMNIIQNIFNDRTVIIITHDQDIIKYMDNIIDLNEE